MKTIGTLFIGIVFFLFACSTSDSEEITETDLQESPKEIKLYKILSLGDSYTVGEGVCAACSFPEQLRTQLQKREDSIDLVSLDIVATTGWTTADLLQGIERSNLDPTYDLVTLLIGVNNQFQGIPISVYEEEFPTLLQKAIFFAGNQKNKVIVLSIPDYAYTPFLNGDRTTSQEIESYNRFAEDYCNKQNVKFLHVTDITQKGLENPSLVAGDGLHPSEKAYQKFVERLLPLVLNQ